MCFCMLSYPQQFNKWVTRIILIISGSVSLLTLFAPVYIFSNLLPAYQLFFLVGTLYDVVAVIVAARAKEEGAWLVLIGFSFLLSTAIVDILFTLGISPIDGLVPFGLIFFIFVQSVILAMRFAKAFKRVEALSVELMHSQKETEFAYGKLQIHHDKLEGTVKARTADLETAMKEAEAAMQEAEGG